MNAAEIQVPMAEAEERFAATRFHGVNAPALLLLIWTPRVEHHAVTRLERRAEVHRNPLTLDAAYFAQINAAFLAEPGVGEFLVVDSAKPARVKPARKSHFQIVTRFLAHLPIIRGSPGHG